MSVIPTIGRAPRAALAATLFAALAGTALAAPAAAETRHAATFDVQIRGVRAGVLAFSGVENAGRYAVFGRLESTGLVGAILPFRFEAEARGRIDGATLRPDSYSETAGRGDDVESAAITYVNGTPRVAEPDPERAARPWAIAPEDQRGTLDPLSAIYAALRDTRPEAACDMRIDTYDGDRRARLTLSTPVAESGGVACTGEYRRIAGYPPEDLAEKARFPFRLIYTPGPDGLLRVREVILDTVHGRSTLRRR